MTDTTTCFHCGSTTLGHDCAVWNDMRRKWKAELVVLALYGDGLGEAFRTGQAERAALLARGLGR